MWPGLSTFNSSLELLQIFISYFQYGISLTISPGKSYALKFEIPVCLQLVQIRKDPSGKKRQMLKSIARAKKENSERDFIKMQMTNKLLLENKHFKELLDAVRSFLVDVIFILRAVLWSANDGLYRLWWGGAAQKGNAVMQNCKHAGPRFQRICLKRLLFSESNSMLSQGKKWNDSAFHVVFLNSVSKTCLGHKRSIEVGKAVDGWEIIYSILPSLLHKHRRIGFDFFFLFTSFEFRVWSDFVFA